MIPINVTMSDIVKYIVIAILLTFTALTSALQEGLLTVFFNNGYVIIAIIKFIIPNTKNGFIYYKNHLYIYLLWYCLNSTFIITPNTSCLIGIYTTTWNVDWAVVCIEKYIII